MFDRDKTDKRRKLKNQKLTAWRREEGGGVYKLYRFLEGVRSRKEGRTNAGASKWIEKKIGEIGCLSFGKLKKAEKKKEGGNCRMFGGGTYRDPSWKKENRPKQTRLVDGACFWGGAEADN